MNEPVNALAGNTDQTRQLGLSDPRIETRSQRPLPRNARQLAQRCPQLMLALAVAAQAGDTGSPARLARRSPGRPEGGVAKEPAFRRLVFARRVAGARGAPARGAARATRAAATPPRTEAQTHAAAANRRDSGASVSSRLKPATHDDVPEGIVSLSAVSSCYPMGEQLFVPECLAGLQSRVLVKCPRLFPCLRPGARAEVHEADR